MNGRTAWRILAAALATGALFGAFVACGSTDTSEGADGGAEGGADGTVDSPFVPEGSSFDGAGRDGGGRDSATNDAAVDAPEDARPDSRPAYCVGQGATSLNVVCPPAGALAACDGGGACSSTGSVTFTTCSAAGCTGTMDGIDPAVVCGAGANCTLSTGGIDYCAVCGASATCAFNETGSAGSQVFSCASGSDCTVALSGASGDRLIDCVRAKRCRVTGIVSGFTSVYCPADCNVTVQGGFSEVCCDTPPVKCADGHYICPPSSDAGDASADGPDAC